MFPFVNMELKVRNETRDKDLVHYVLDITQIDPDELAWFIREYQRLKKLKDMDLNKSFAKEVERILRKTSRSHGNVHLTNPLIADPAFAPLLDLVAFTGVKKIRTLWWCDGGVRGLFGGVELCTDAEMREFRRGVALNPVSVSDMVSGRNLDTVLDTRGHHITGSIGKNPMSLSYGSAENESKLTGYFTGASNTTIRSILLLGASNSSPYYDNYCEPYIPSALDHCVKYGYYASIYALLYGWDVELNVYADDVYSITIRIYL